MDIPTGVIRPPPMPCTIRNTTNCCTDAASPHAADAIVKSPTDSRNTSRAPNRSPSHPATGIATATATRKPMFTVAVSSTGTPKSAAMVGNATLTTVASMMLMNMAATKTVATAVLGLIRAITSGGPGEGSGGEGCAHPHFTTSDLIPAVRPPAVDVPPTMEAARPVGPWVIILARVSRVGPRQAMSQQTRRPGRPLTSTRRSFLMTELDLGSSAGSPARPGTPTSTALVLTPPAPVQVVKPEQAAGAVPVPEGRQAELQTRASAFAIELAALDVRSPEFAKKVESITALGDREMRESSNVSSRMLERPAAAVSAAKGRGGNDAQTRVASTLSDLRLQITELDPNRADLTGIKKVLKWIPGGNKIDSYFAKYQSAQSHLDAIVRALASGKDELGKDNASIEVEKANMWTLMGKLGEYNELASALDTAVEDQVRILEGQGRTEDANTLRADALFPIRQRRQDIMTQMAVAVQGYMALDLIRKNNLELMRGVDRAQTTTIAALRTAVIVSQALARQKLVLDQITGLNAATGDLIQRTSEQLKIQGAQINEQAASATVSVEKLQAAFDNVFQTMDAVDTFRAQAVDSMALTVNALQGQIERAQPYLERVRRNELGSS